MKHFKILVKIWFVAIKAVLAIKCKKNCIRVTERLKIYDSRKYRKNLENEWKQSQVPSLPYADKTLVLMVEKYANWNIKVPWPCPILLDFLNCFINFVRDCLRKQFFSFRSSQSPEKFNILISLLASKPFFQIFNADKTRKATSFKSLTFNC